jgi:FMN phosphatase YigB (HAD superfamily)
MKFRMRLPWSTVRASTAGITMLASESLPSLITFDCTGTLFEPTESIGALYKRATVAEAWKAGLASAVVAEALSEEELCTAFRPAYAAADRSRPCFGADRYSSENCSSESWWRDVVADTITTAAQNSKGCAPVSELEAILPQVFYVLYHETFQSRSAFRLTAHAADVLSALGEWRASRSPSEPALVLGVISNWDERLPLLLKRLGVQQTMFDFVLTSHELGIEKPDARIFEKARELAGASAGIEPTSCRVPVVSWLLPCLAECMV